MRKGAREAERELRGLAVGMLVGKALGIAYSAASRAFTAPGSPGSEATADPTRAGQGDGTSQMPGDPARVAQSDGNSQPAGEPGRVASSGGGEARPMEVVRTVQRGEKVSDLINEGKARTWVTGDEHALVTRPNGERQIVRGGPGASHSPKGRSSVS